jgi:nucleotide-binding universal stress UspA family protein
VPESEILNARKNEPRSSRRHDGQPIFRHVLACVNDSAASRAALAHAAAIASATGARLTAMRVLEPPPGQVSTDPVEWRLRLHDAEVELKHDLLEFSDPDAKAVVIGGQAAECICAWARDNGIDLTVLSATGDGNWPFSGLGGTARRVVEVTNSSVLLVPRSEPGDAAICYRRVMAPLDGSPRSECALPITMAIAAAHEAEVVLVHAAPNIELTEIGPVEAEAVALRDKLRHRNELVAEKYFKQVKSRLPPRPVATRTRVLASGDPRHALARAAVADRSDIIILCSTGLGAHPDLSVGSVAEYLISHADKPILLVRANEWTPPQTHRRAEDAPAVRLPSRALN